MLLVPFAPGGIADLTARAVARAMAGVLGQPVVVDNRPSAGSIVASQAVARAAPDGHTLLLMSNAHAVSAGLFRTLPYDAVRDFAPIALLASFDLAFFVAAESRFDSLKTWLAQARAQPGKLTIGSITPGSTQHLTAELLKARAGIDAVVVPYKGTPAVLTALRAGEIDLAVEILAPWLPQLQARAVRALAVASAQRCSAAPEVPTLKELGVADAEASSWNALAAPAGTPAAVVQRLNRAADVALRDPAVRAQLLPLGVRLHGGPPEQLQHWLAQEIRHWAAVMRSAKIEPQ
ncbi:tripartite tricarboxylate transporter substrate-binding protein [Aquabacterium sp.]|uniref:tripartite tricarboxylate transporter substrate-binding protein n=1 Tax=Aquabacterium sp. TaxID=1872578 RepID=UPI00378491F8